MRIKEQHAMAKNQNNNVAPATKKTGAEAKKDALATALEVYNPVNQYA